MMADSNMSANVALFFSVLAVQVTKHIPVIIVVDSLPPIPTTLLKVTQGQNIISFLSLTSLTSPLRFLVFIDAQAKLFPSNTSFIFLRNEGEIRAFDCLN